MYIYLHFSVYNSKQVNVRGIQIFRAQFLALHLPKVMLNAANIYLLGIILTQRKYIYRSFYGKMSTFNCTAGFSLHLQNSTAKNQDLPFIFLFRE